MTSNHNATVCGLPSWIGIVRNDTVAYINDILLATVSGSCAIFALLSNMGIIVAVSRNPSLQKRSSILLCGLAFADCLVLPRVLIAIIPCPDRWNILLWASTISFFFHITENVKNKYRYVF